MRTLHVFVDFIDFDLVNRIVGVSPCHPQAKIGLTILIQTYEQKAPPAVIHGAAPDSRWPRNKIDHSEKMSCQARRRQAIEHTVPVLPFPAPRPIKYRTKAITSRVYRPSLWCFGALL